MEIIPKKGLSGLVENWQSDLMAAFSVAMVALPLGLGIALASGVPPIAGIFSAIIGGLVTTFYRGSHIAINGPGAGLIAVTLSAMLALDDGTGQALNYVLAAIMVSGLIQVVLGLLKLGRYADMFHGSVIRGILAAIGIIILAKQIHIALGTNQTSNDVVQDLIGVFYHAADINPVIALISGSGLLLLIFHSKISYKLFHIFPAPMWVLILSIPFVYIFNFFEPHEIALFGRNYHIGPEMLVNVPDNFLDAIAHPNFSKIGTLPFWSAVVSITMIASIESLAAGKAVDKLDPYKRKTNLNKDLVGVGLSTMISGLIGGLPVITVIVRSTVNIHNNAKTRWSNFYHGVLLLLFIFLLSPVIQKVPLCALATLLVYTGFRLASPKVFKQVYDQGFEQLIFFIGTFVLTLFTNLLIGIFGGLLLALVVHILVAKLPISTFFRMVISPRSRLFKKKDNSYELKIRGIANFLAAIKVDKLIKQVPPLTRLNVDFSGARLVDFSILENVFDFQRQHESNGGKVTINGLDKHIASSPHRLALRISMHASPSLTTRQTWLKKMAEEYGWQFNSEPDNQVEYYRSFYFFRPRPVEYKYNCISGQDRDLYWESTDIAFDEGAFISTEEYKTTIALVKLPFAIPKFTIEKTGFLGKYFDPAKVHKDIDYVLYKDFPSDYIVKVEDKKVMKAFMTESFKTMILKNDVHHLESNGEAIMLFNDKLKLARIRDYAKFIKFTEELKQLLMEKVPS